MEGNESEEQNSFVYSDSYYSSEDNCSKHDESVADDEDEQENVDIYTQLAQKERDLILAAELGKALLEKNDELQKAVDSAQDEYSDKLELLEQEKHALRRKLESVQSEYESKITELQSDVVSVRGQLDCHQQRMVQHERSKAEVVTDLSEQNHRLTNQLRESSAKEAELTAQLSSLKETFNMKKTSIHEHVSQLECLRAEIQVLTERREELEKRIQSLSSERDEMGQSLDDASDRILMLERHQVEQDHLLRLRERELEESRQRQEALQEKVDSLQREGAAGGASLGGSHGSQSLFNELQISKMLEDSEMYPATSQHSSGIEEDEDIECDDDLSMTESHQMGYFARLPCHSDEETFMMRQEVFGVYRHLQKMCGDVKKVRADSGLPEVTPEESEAVEQEQLQTVEVEPVSELNSQVDDPNDLHVGQLSNVMKELAGLMKDIVQAEMRLVHPDQVRTMENQLQHMTDEVSNTRLTLERMKHQMEMRDEEIRAKAAELSQLTEKLSLQHAEVNKLTTDRDRMLDEASGGQLERDSVVQQARQDRDDALRRSSGALSDSIASYLDMDYYSGHSGLKTSTPSEEYAPQEIQEIVDQQTARFDEQQSGHDVDYNVCPGLEDSLANYLDNQYYENHGGLKATDVDFTSCMVGSMQQPCQVLEYDEVMQQDDGRNAMEIELAKSRVDMMSLNSQLMEAINQKLELSQQLEQWEYDDEH